MDEKKHVTGEHVDVAIGEVDVAVAAQRPKRDLFLPISILAAALFIGGSVVFATIMLTRNGGVAAPGGAPAGNNGGGNAVAGTATTTPPAQVMTLGPRDAILGNASATVTLIEYGDYQCPYCGEFFDQTEPQIIQNYVNTGKVRMVFRDFAFLGTESTAAAEAAQCANDQGKLWPYHNALYAAKYADFTGGGKEDDGFFNRTEFLKLAGQVGLNIPQFTGCIDGNTDAGVVSQELNNAETAGVNSTPTFFVNGQEISGAQPYTTFQQAINSALQG